MNIVLFRGEGQYEIFESRFDYLANGLRDAGQDVVELNIIELAKKQITREEIFDQVRKVDPPFTVGINGIYPHFEGKPDFYDLNDKPIPHFSFFVDHPLHQIHRFGQPKSDNLIVSCQDRHHMDYCEYLNKSPDTVSFLPSAVSQSLSQEFPIQDELERDFVFLGSVPDPESIRSEIKKQTDEACEQLIHQALNILREQPEQSIMNVLYKVLVNNGISSQWDDQKFVRQMAYFIERAFRSLTRNELLEEFSGFDCHIYGDVHDREEGVPNLFKNRLHERVGRNESLQLMSSSLCVVNFCQVLSDGTHPRVMDGLLCGRPVLTTYSRYLDEEFGEECGVFQFKSNDRNSLRKKAQYILNHRNEVEKRAQIGRRKVLNNHTWTTRAEQIIEKMT